MLFTVIGGTGEVGSAAARFLLSAGHQVRVAARGSAGAEPVFLDLDEEVGDEAFRDADGAFLMTPPGFSRMSVPRRRRVRGWSVSRGASRGRVCVVSSSCRRSEPGIPATSAR